MSDHFDKLLKLSDVLNKRVADVVGYISNEFDEPTFKVVAVKFKDGSYETCGGGHDFPYVKCDVPERFVEKDEEDGL